jgi:periplasmic copper chaperone A
MKILLITLVSIVWTASTGFSNAQDMMVMKPVVAAPALAQAKTAAAYLELMNMGKQDDVLLSITTPAAETAMLHESKDENGVMRMMMLDHLDIPAGKTVVIAPGHMHIMLTGLKAPLKIGDHVALALAFKKSGRISVDALVGKIDEMKLMKHTN